MNALTQSPWSTCRKALCAAGLAALASGALADEVATGAKETGSKVAPAQSELRQAMDARVVRQAQDARLGRAEIPAVKNRKGGSWTEPELPMSWSRVDQQREWYPDDTYLTAMNNFDTGSLFRTRKELLYQDTLRLLLTKRQVRVWLRDNLHLQCEVKRWHTVDDGSEVGLKLGVYYQFD